MPDYFFHYTSRQAAQDVSAMGYLMPGPRGKLYLTETLYTSGAEAANRLAITGKPVEVIGFVPKRLVNQTGQPQAVRPLREGALLIREGGGTELWVSDPIPAGDVHWLELNAP